MKIIFRPLWQQAIVASSWLRTGFWLMSMTPPLITSSTGENEDGDDDNADYDDHVYTIRERFKKKNIKKLTNVSFGLTYIHTP